MGPGRVPTILRGLALLTLLLVTPRLRATDEIQYFSYLHSVFFDRDLEFGNEYEYFYSRNPKGLELFKGTFLDKREPLTGRHLNFTPIGAALLWSPFYLIAHVALLAAQALGAKVSPDGLSRPYEAAVCYASALYGIAGLFLVHDALSRFGRFAEPAASWATAALWLGSPVLYYLVVAPGFAHAVGLFVVALLFWLFLRSFEHGGPSLGEAFALGALGGLAALVREQDGLFLIIPAAYVVFLAAGQRDFRAGASRLLAMGGAAALVFAPQLLVYHVLNGHYGPSRLVTRKMTYWSPHFLGVLFDPGHGLFLWTPLLFVAVLGLGAAVWLRRDAPSVLAALGVLLQFWINGSIESWTQAGAFGSRRFVDASPLFAWGLAAALVLALPRLGGRATAACLALLVWWNVSLMAQFGLKLMDRQRLDFPEVAINQVTKVPPRLARALVLFVTDRERLVREGL
jgi:hypothetical protein